MYQYNNEALYIAGPECFYQNGYELWWAQRKLAEYYGIPVVLPTSTELKLNNSDLRLNAKEIFDDLIFQVGKTTAIIARKEYIAILFLNCCSVYIFDFTPQMSTSCSKHN